MRWITRRVVPALLLIAALALPATAAQEQPPLPEGLAPPEAESKSSSEEPPLPEGLGGETDRSSEPSLPEGLGDDAAPALPEGLGGEEEEPALPAGLGDEAEPSGEEKEEADRWEWPEGLSGFIDARGGVRVQDDPNEHTGTLAETRLQLEYQRHLDPLFFKVTADVLYDGIADTHRLDLETGQGWLDLREAYLSLSPFSFMDVKAGRQILTWGTGDLLFLNDLFPKDWQSFFSGRDIEYLKAPSDAVKVSFFTDLANLDVVWTPRFDPDRFIDGSRFSYWSDMAGSRVGRNMITDPARRADWLSDSELHMRLYRNVRGYELAAYGYRGYWKSPAGMEPATGRPTFPRLNVLGASVRGQVGPGIGNAEFAWYDSSSDRNGTDPFISNSELRFLLGYEQELWADFTAGAQYYLEHMLDYEDYRRTLPAGIRARDENRHLLTLRLTQLLLQQNLTLSLFTFYSPSDNDAHLRPNIHYKISNRWSAEIGANVFWGQEEHTFFGQFSRNSNVYAGVRYSF